MILELRTLVDQLEEDPDVTVVVFDSANADHFVGPALRSSLGAGSIQSSRFLYWRIAIAN